MPAAPPQCSLLGEAAVRGLRDLTLLPRRPERRRYSQPDSERAASAGLTGNGDTSPC